jgi:hypothetical protein
MRVRYLAEWLERLPANAVVATVLDSIPASSDTVKFEGRQMKQCWISYMKRKNHPVKKAFSWLWTFISVMAGSGGEQRGDGDPELALRVGD